MQGLKGIEGEKVVEGETYRFMRILNLQLLIDLSVHGAGSKQEQSWEIKSIFVIQGLSSCLSRSLIYLVCSTNDESIYCISAP